MPATVGVAADVPPTSSGMPPMIVQNWSPFAHTSGKPAPLWLYIPGMIAWEPLAICALYAATIVAWYAGIA